MPRNPPSRRQARLERRRTPPATEWVAFNATVTPHQKARIAAWSKRCGVTVRLETVGFLLKLPGETHWRVFPRDALPDLMSDVARSEAQCDARRGALRRAGRAAAASPGPAG